MIKFATFRYSNNSNAFTNAELSVLKSDVNLSLSMCNNYLQETAIKISIRFSVKT